MRVVKSGFIGVLVGLACLPTFAEFSANPDGTTPPPITRYEQRELYRNALHYIRSGQISRYREAQDSLVDYPLYPYLEYMYKIYYLSRQNANAILGFKEQYPDTPIADQLIQNWLYHLATRGQWTEFLKYYSEDLAAPKIACYNAYALYRTGQLEAAWAAARDLWLVNYSQPDECDPIFKVFRAENQLTSDLAWQRFTKSLTSGNVNLANYLVRFLDRDDKRLANNLKMVHLRPYNVQKTSTFREDHEKNRFIIAHGVERLARINANAAHDAFRDHLALHNFSEEVKERVWVTVGIHLTFDGDPLNYLDKLPINIAEHPDLAEARIRFALRRQAWGEALVYLNLLPEDFKASPRWQYWKARILMGSADDQDRRVARETFAALATERNYYGFLAADTIGQPYNFQDNPMPISQEQILSLETTPGIQRALELFVLNELSRARREWYFTTAEFSDIERQIAARVARKWGWYRHAIHSMIRAEAWDDLEIRFPLAYQHAFIANARTADIPLHWSMAVARQESAFMPDARSSAGAMGIMQLMPATAALVASDMNMSSVSESDLTDPSLNIQLGSYYLGSLLREFNQNRIIATAAYNAGPGRVRQWIDPSLPLDVWIETIPYRETRHYVQNVLMFSTIYGRRLEVKHPMIYNHEREFFSTRRVTLSVPRPAPDNS